MLRPAVPALVVDHHGRRLSASTPPAQSGALRSGHRRRPKGDAVKHHDASRRRFLRGAVVGAAAAVAGPVIVTPTAAFATTEEERFLGQIKIGALFRGYLGAPLGLKGTTSWEITISRSNKVSASLAIAQVDTEQYGTLATGPDGYNTCGARSTYLAARSASAGPLKEPRPSPWRRRRKARSRSRNTFLISDEGPPTATVVAGTVATAGGRPVQGAVLLLRVDSVEYMTTADQAGRYAIRTALPVKPGRDPLTCGGQTKTVTVGRSLPRPTTRWEAYMRRVLHRAALALGLVLAGMPILAVHQAYAEARTIAVVNSATFRPCDRTLGTSCANGSLLSFYVSPPPTDFRGDTPDWPDELSDGFHIRLDECGLNLRITGVYPSGGGVQINTYQQGNVGDEPGGQCPVDDYRNGYQDVIWEVFGATAEFGVEPLAYGGRLWLTTPSVADNTVNGVDTAAGFHLIPSPTGDHTYTPLTTCLVEPSRCPVRTNGQLNYLVFYVNGMEDDGCPDRNPCDSTWAFRLDGPNGEQNFLTVTYTGTEIGYQQVNLQLVDGVNPGVQHRLGQQNRHAQVYFFISQTNLKFTFS